MKMNSLTSAKDFQARSLTENQYSDQLAVQGLYANLTYIL